MQNNDAAGDVEGLLDQILYMVRHIENLRVLREQVEQAVLLFYAP